MTAPVDGRPLETVGGPPIPLGRRVELEGRGTTFVREVTGPPGAPTLLLSHGWIASGGLNWYVLGTRSWRMTFDVTRINHSPADNDLTGYSAGESGTLFQLQMLTDF